MTSPHPVYDLLFRAVFTRLDPEVAHHRAARAIEQAGAWAPLRRAVTWTLGRGLGEAGSGVEVFGRTLSSPLGAAAGFDKNATMVRGLLALGFSHVEIGTVTAYAQPGNERPRLFRLVDRRALVNRMGFNNVGSERVAERLAALRATRSGARAVIGVNIGKTKVTPSEHAATDYARSARALAPYADYLVVNVSSPNTPGLRDLQAVDSLRPILAAVRDAVASVTPRQVPVLVKIAPDLADADIEAVARLVVELDLAGVVATNTTIRHEHGAGGMSGEPLRARALDVVAHVRTALDALPGGQDKVIIGVGGVSTADHARALLAAGATLVQAYSAFIYSGPAWPGVVARALRR